MSEVLSRENRPSSSRGRVGKTLLGGLAAISIVAEAPSAHAGNNDQVWGIIGGVVGNAVQTEHCRDDVARRADFEMREARGRAQFEIADINLQAETQVEWLKQRDLTDTERTLELRRIELRRQESIFYVNNRLRELGQSFDTQIRACAR